MWVKICGLTTEAGVEAAVAAGADAIGFVFAPSKRRVDVARARALARGVPSHIMRVAVMQHPAQSLVDEVLSLFHPDALQTDREDLDALRLPSALAVIPVWRGIAGGAALPARLLFEGAVSGTGSRSDWDAAASLARTTQVILAGGLSEDNVGAAIAKVRPYGVDVSSGVEREPGIKDPAKIARFVSAARAAS